MISVGNKILHQYLHNASSFDYHNNLLMPSDVNSNQDEWCQQWKLQTARYRRQWNVHKQAKYWEYAAAAAVSR